MEDYPVLNENILLENKIPKWSQKQKILATSFAVVLLFLIFLSTSAPSSFPVGTVLKVEQGESLRSVSFKLKERNLIRSRTVFEAFVIVFGKERHVISTDYYFETKLPVYELARRISKGEHHMAPVSITIPEGFDVLQIADTFASKLVNFNKDNFIKNAETKEGYLFPDTYFFFNIDTEQEVLDLMVKNFEKKVEPLRPAIDSSGKTEKEIIVMASIIEREAKGDADRDLISGILWRRINIGMPLQVDAAPDTYKTKGLPKTPIANPGLMSIKASINPVKSSYLYYLHDKDGAIHYAKTFQEHKDNINKYLR